MSDETTPVPGTDPAPAAAAGAGSVAPAGGDAASAGLGDAPGAGGDAQADASAAAPVTAAQASAAYRILNREFRDQKHAEEVLGAELGRTRGLQRQLSERDAELKTLRELLAARSGTVPVQGDGRGPAQPAGPKSLAEEIRDDADLYQKIATDPEMGVGHALYALAQSLDTRLESLRDSIVNEVINPRFQQAEGEKMIARALTAAKTLGEKFPEIADYGPNPPEEIQQAQEEILAALSEFPPAYLAQHPERAIRQAILEYRDLHGIPRIARPPGTSGSPSAIVAAAAERAAAAGAPAPLEGSGTPPPGERKGPKTLVDRWKEDAAKLPREAKSPSGRPLGFEELAP